MAAPSRLLLSDPSRDAGDAELLRGGRGLLRAVDFEVGTLSRSRLHRLERSGSLVCVAKGVYADAAALRAADDWSAFLLRTRAFLLVAARDSYASDWSSVVLHELPTVGRPPKVPNVIRPGSRFGGSNTTRNGRTRFAAVPDRWLGEGAGSPAVHPAFAAVDIARQGGRLTGLVLADAVAFRHGGREESTGALTDVAGWRGAARAEWAVALRSRRRIAAGIAGTPCLPQCRSAVRPEQRVGG